MITEHEKSFAFVTFALLQVSGESAVLGAEGTKSATHRSVAGTSSQIWRRWVARDMKVIALAIFAVVACASAGESKREAKLANLERERTEAVDAAKPFWTTWSAMYPFASQGTLGKVNENIASWNWYNTVAATSKEYSQQGAALSANSITWPYLWPYAFYGAWAMYNPWLWYSWMWHARLVEIVAACSQWLLSQPSLPALPARRLGAHHCTIESPSLLTRPSALCPAFHPTPTGSCLTYTAGGDGGDQRFVSIGKARENRWWCFHRAW